MFGHQKLLDAITELLRRHTWQQNWRIQEPEKELEKVQAKNSILRRDRRHLRTILEENDISWVRETPGVEAIPTSKSS